MPDSLPGDPPGATLRIAPECERSSLLAPVFKRAEPMKTCPTLLRSRSRSRSRSRPTAHGARAVTGAALAVAMTTLAAAAPGAGASAPRAHSAASASHLRRARTDHRHARRATPHGPSAARAALNQRRALDAYTAMQRAYFLPGSGLYRGSPFAPAWPYSQAMAATISVAALPRQHRRYQADLIARLSGLQAYSDHVDPAPAGYAAQARTRAGQSNTRFNDDNEWIAIELLRLYHLNRQRALLGAATQLFGLVTAQWDQRPGVPCPGGVPWQSPKLNGDRNTVTDAPGAELGAQLYLTTGDTGALGWATRMYAWTRGCLLHADGLYGDHIDGQGQVDDTEWTYNQGAMIGAGVMLYRATHDATYLRQAETTARAALAAFGPAQLAQQPVYFNAIYIRNLLLLSQASGDARYQRFAQSFADDAWRNVRDARSGLFLADPGGATQLLDQASMVQVYALLAEPTRAYF